MPVEDIQKFRSQLQIDALGGTDAFREAYILTGISEAAQLGVPAFPQHRKTITINRLPFNQATG